MSFPIYSARSARNTVLWSFGRIAFSTLIGAFALSHNAAAGDMAVAASQLPDPPIAAQVPIVLRKFYCRRPNWRASFLADDVDIFISCYTFIQRIRS
jgi:hypothetical protein